MKKQCLKKLTGAFAFAIAAVLFGAPSSPMVEPVPTVGGDALAYAPCSLEYMAMGTTQLLGSFAESFVGPYVTQWVSGYVDIVYDQAVQDYLSCRYG